MNKDEAKMDNQDSEPDDCPGLMNCRERKYSIYSTDTEERIISVDKGLDRCAAVLQSLLAEGGKMMMMGPEGRPVGIKEKPSPAWRKGMVCKARPCRSLKEEGRHLIANDHRKKVDGFTRVQLKRTADSNCAAHPAACSTPDKKLGVRPAVLHNATKDRRIPTKVEEREQMPLNGGPLQKGLPSLPPTSRAKQQRNIAWPVTKAAKDITERGKTATCPHCKCATRGKGDGGSLPPPPLPLPSCYHSPYGFPWLPPPYPFPICSPPHPHPHPHHHHQSCSLSSQQLPEGPPSVKAPLRSNPRKNELRKMDALDLASLQCWPPPPRVPPMDYYYWYFGNHGFQPPHGQPSSDQPPPCCDMPPPPPVPQYNINPVRPQVNLPDGHQNSPCLEESDPVDGQQITRDTDQETYSTPPDLDHKLTADHHQQKVLPQTLLSNSQPSKNSLFSKTSSSQASVKTGVTATSSGSNRGGVIFARTVPLPKLEDVSDVQGLQVVLEDLMTCCEENLRNMRAGNNGVMGTRLAHLGEMVEQMKGHLVEQCRRITVKVRQDRRNEKSVTDWLAQTQQLEEEKAGLIERLKESCTAYSELRRKLDSVEEEKQDQHKKLEEVRQEAFGVRTELDAMSANMKQVSANLRLKEAELTNIQSSTLPVQELITKNAALEKQIAVLDEEVDHRKEKVKILRGELKRAKRALSDSKEEEQMLRVTVQSKGTQLLEVQDKLLGMRQCLACFLSCLSKFRAARQETGTLGPSSVFLVPTEELEKLKLLAEDGNIENYLSSSYDKRENQKVTFLDTIEDRTEGSVAKVRHTREKEPPTKEWDILSSCSTSSSRSDYVITPLGSSSFSDHNDSRDGSTTPTSQTEHFVLPALDHQLGIPSSRHFQSGSSKSSQPEPNLSTGSKINQIQSYQKLANSPAPPSLSSVTDESGSHGYPVRHQVPSLTDVRSSLTTASEVDFRKDLATLDADIARLQVQFRIALQPSQNM